MFCHRCQAPIFQGRGLSMIVYKLSFHLLQKAPVRLLQRCQFSFGVTLTLRRKNSTLVAGAGSLNKIDHLSQGIKELPYVFQRRCGFMSTLGRATNVSTGAVDDSDLQTTRSPKPPNKERLTPRHDSERVRIGTAVDPSMIDGEMVFATRENYKRHEHLYRMFQLNTTNTFRTKYGAIDHADIIGQLAGRIFTTDLGIDVMIRRPTLEEFVLYMKRTPVISYPKDCCTMLMMVDASPGDVILEAGTGSGAMTLFLSRAVGPSGCVHSFEAKPEHQKRAIQNVTQWAASWNLSHPGQPWPDNVCYHTGKLESSNKHLDPALLVDGGVLDMERPHQAIPALATRLKSGRAAVVYVANITQIIEMAEYLRVLKLPLTVEKIIEVDHRVWVVNQARRHSGSSLGVPGLASDATSDTAPETVSLSDGDAGCKEEESLSSSAQYIEDHIPKYIARPHNNQPGHSAFLVTLRKIDSASSTYKL